MSLFSPFVGFKGIIIVVNHGRLYNDNYCIIMMGI